jgi:oligoribonuclease
MTGLDVTRCVILQAAVVVTDHDLVEQEALELDLGASDAELAVMDDFVREMHTRSGLLDRVRASRLTVAEAEERMLDVLRRHTQPKTSVLCGNSVWMDRLFLARYAPRFVAWLHYRLVDVSSVKTLMYAWKPETAYAKEDKDKAHTAMADIRESIAELRHYRSALFE